MTSRSIRSVDCYRSSENEKYLEIFSPGGLQEGAAGERRLPPEGERQQQHRGAEGPTGGGGGGGAGAGGEGAGEPVCRPLDARGGQQPGGAGSAPRAGRSPGRPKILSEGHPSASPPSWSTAAPHGAECYQSSGSKRPT